MKIASFYALILTILTPHSLFLHSLMSKISSKDKVTIQFQSITIQTGDHSCDEALCRTVILHRPIS